MSSSRAQAPGSSRWLGARSTLRWYRRVGAAWLESLRDFVELDVRERVADEGAPVRLGEPAALQGFDHFVEPLEVVGIHRDTNDLVVGGLFRARAGFFPSFGTGYVKASAEHAVHVLVGEDACGGFAQIVA